MEKGYKILGNYIRLVDERNRDLAVTKLLGVSISKKFIPSIANIVGTDLSNYRIVRTGQFVYGPVTSRNGEKISIAYLDEEDCIISSSYTVFEVENKEELDPEYLMLWFSRPEFDRYHKSDCTLNWFVKAMIDNSLQEILSAATGSTFPNVGKDLLNGFQVIIPDDNSLRKFGVKGHSIFSMISNNAKEIDVLLGLQRTLLSKLTI